ncbi:hypothetical protein Tco_1224409 [Tanacetum coccineum]
MLVWGETDSETLPKRSLRRKLFKICCMNWGEVNPTHAYYNGSCSSKDTEDPSWSTSIKTGSHKCHLHHWKHFLSPYYVVIVLDRNIIEILHDVVGTSGYHCGVLRSFPVERIEQRIG